MALLCFFRMAISNQLVNKSVKIETASQPVANDKKIFKPLDSMEELESQDRCNEMVR